MSKSRIHKRHLSKKHKKETRKMLLEFLKIVWYQLHIIIDYFIDLIFGWYYNDKQVKIPPISKPFLTESATSIAESIRLRKRTSEEVVSGFIERIREVNSVINAVVDDRFEEAIQEAKEIDKNIAEGKFNEETFKKQPFLGVPFTTKETTACAGLSFTFGLLSRKGERAETDAEVVRLMKDAGAILIANTNVPEFNQWQETRNNLFGATCNPYNTTRTTGGSSGGEAALIASCGTAFGIGTDIGGSIRMPAFFCGVFGHKPTSHLISTKGLTKRTGLETHTMVVAGPMSRHAKDLAPILKILVGSNVNKLCLDMPVDVTTLKYFYVDEIKSPRVSSMCSELKDLMKKVTNHFLDECCDHEESVTCLEIPELEHSFRLWRYWMTQEPMKFNYELGNGKPVNVYTELFKKLTGQCDFTMAAIFKLVDDHILPKEKEDWAQRTTTELRTKLLKELNKNGILLFPSYTWPASYHYTAFFRPFNFCYWGIFNALHFPVTQVPLGLSQDGLPMGIQVVAAPYNDHLCIAVAKHLEKVFGGYVPPFH